MARKKAAKGQLNLLGAPENGRSAVQRCMDAYYRAFVRRFNPPDIAEKFLADRESVPLEQVTRPMIHGGKDGANLKKMIAAWGEARVLRLCEEFPFSTHPRAVRSDYSLGALFSLAQFLLIDEARPDDRTAHNRHEAAAATGRRR